MTNTSTATKSLTPFDILKAENPTVYISGPVTGLPEWNAPAFAAAEAMLLDMKLTPVNPHKIVDWSGLEKDAGPLEEWAFAMKQDLKGLMGCNAVIMLPDWGNSIGAIWEFLNAKTLKMPVFQYLKPENIFTAPSFELITLTNAEYVELFFKITDKVRANDMFIINKFITK